jgi:hypothetical protein
MAAVQTVKLKGNPAHHRMGNPRNKALRAECWARGHARKMARNASQMAAAERNRLSGTSPWEETKAARRARRSA